MNDAQVQNLMMMLRRIEGHLIQLVRKEPDELPWFISLKEVIEAGDTETAIASIKGAIKLYEREKEKDERN